MKRPSSYNRVKAKFGLVMHRASAWKYNAFLKFTFFAVCVLLACQALAQTPQGTQILLLHSYNQGYIWSDDLTQGVVSVLNDSSLDIQLTVEYMDTKRISDVKHFENLLSLYSHKFRDVIFDVVITSDDDAFLFALKYRDELFKDVPIVFCGLTHYEKKWREEYGNFTGIVETLDISKTMNLALQLHSEADKIFIVNDLTPSGEQRHSQYEQASKKLERKVAVEFLENYSMEELLTILRNLPQNSVVILQNFNRDNKGQLFSNRRSGTMVCDASVRPVYSSHGHNLGLGIVGGFLTYGKIHGEIAGKMALEMLEGKTADDIPVILESPNPPMFDYGQLLRWGIPMGQLPADSVFVDDTLTKIREKRMLVAALIFMAIEALIILLLIVNFIWGLTGKPLFVNLAYRIIALAFIFGLMVMMLNTLMNYLFFYEGKSFLSLLIFDATPLEIYRRSIVLISFTIFGIILSIILVKQRQYEKELRESEIRFRNIFQQAYQFSVLLDLEGRVIEANDLCYKETGLTKEQVIGFPFTDMPWWQKGKDVEKGVQEDIQIALNGKVAYREMYFINANNEERCGDRIISPLYDEKGKIIFLLVQGIDTTERKHAEEELKVSEESYRSIFNSVNDVIFVHDAETGKILKANQKTADMFGYTAEELSKVSVEDISSGEFPYTQAEAIKLIRKAAKEGPQRFEWRSKNRNGNLFWVEVNLRFAVIEGKGTVLGLVRDITERKHAEEELKVSEENYRTIFNSVNDVIFVHDAETGKLLRTNQRTAELFGYTTEELSKKTIRDLSAAPQAMEESIKLVRKAAAEGPQRFEWKYKHKNGKLLWGEVNLRFAVIEGKGTVLALVHDITERKQAQEEREQLLKDLAAKNEELESIVYVSSHDLRSPLINITGYSGVLADSCEEVAALIKKIKVPKEITDKLSSVLLKDISDSLDYIITSAQTMDRLLTGLLRVSRLGQAALDIKSLDINQIIDEVVKSIQFKLNKSGAELIIDKLPPCSGDKSQIKEVFTNVLDNAIKYLDPNRKGLIHVSGKVDNGMSVYCVEDNGVGIAPAQQEKVFEIFHRLEPEESSGEGLGLTIVKRIVVRHRGKIWIESEAGKGSRFYVALPHTKNASE